MPKYCVHIQIEVHAATPMHAAEQAIEEIDDRTHFIVDCPLEGKRYRVDIDAGAVYHDGPIPPRS
jgi:uncharacterized membrane protein YkoI